MKTIKTMISIMFCSISLFSCKEDDTTDPNPDTIAVKGLTYGLSITDFKTTDATIVSVLEGVGPITILAQVNHTNNAASVGKDLDSTKVIIFGNPALGTPLMQKNQLVGLDLPQKLFIWKDSKDSVRVGFNNVSYLKARHGLEDVAELNAIDNALTNFANSVGDGALVSNSAESLKEGEGIITKTSTKTFEETYNTLIAAIEGNANLRLVATLDHQANAASINLELNPARLIVFGNPNLGTPLMQNAQTTGIDLPQKFLVWEDADGNVMVSYNDPAFLVSRHGITENEDIITTITGALDNLSNAAAGL